MHGQNTNIIIATVGTLPTERADQGELALPVAASLLQLIAVLVPVVFLTLRAAILRFRRRSAIRTDARMAPATGVIARHTTEPGLIGTICVDLKWLAALFANLHDLSFGFHGWIVQHLSVVVKSSYYAIAERRIAEAQMQPTLEGLL